MLRGVLHGVLLLCCSEEVRAQLAPHLPEGTEPTVEAMAELLRSPQFAQTTQNLTQV